MWKSLVTGKVLSSNGILFKVVLDFNLLFLAIKLNFFLSVTEPFSGFFFFFFFFLEKLSWVLCKQTLRLSILGESWFMGKLSGDTPVRKWGRPYRLALSWGNRTNPDPCIRSQWLGATSGWGSSQPRAFQASRQLCTNSDNPSIQGMGASDLKRGSSQSTIAPTYFLFLHLFPVWSLRCELPLPVKI